LDQPSFLSVKAGERLSYDQFEIFADTIDLSFEEQSRLASQGKIVFGRFGELSDLVFARVS
jgi:hypothetical protein